MQAVVQACRAGLPSLREQLRMLRGSARGRAGSAALRSSARQGLEAMAAAQPQVPGPSESFMRCDGCGRAAAGLRKCSR